MIDGNTVLKRDVIAKVLQPFGGKQKDFGDVQKALEALQTAYQDAGYGVVQVTLPEQELERGEVRFEVLETRIGKVEVQGNQNYSEANIRRSVPNLREGETPNSNAIARSLKIANENPTKQTQVSLKAGTRDNEVDATIKVVDDKPRKYSITFDNTGTSTTGSYRLGFGFTQSNLWDRDHQLTLAYITDPEHPSKVTVFGLGYRIPLYEQGDSIDLILGYSDVDSGTVQSLFTVSGAGLVLLGRYNHVLKRIGDYEHKLTFGLDYKSFQNNVQTLSGAPLVPDITVHPISATYSGILRKPQSEFSFYSGLWYNAFPGGNDGAQSDFSGPTPPFFPTGSRQNATAEYLLGRYGASYTWLLPDDWMLRAVLNGQYTRNALIAPEQFGIGGWSSVRGFNERQYSMDKGYQKSVELYTPDLAPKLGFTGGGRFKLLTFYDAASVARNFVQPGEQTGISLDSIGVGLRISSRDIFSMRLDFAQVLHDGGQDSNIRDGRRNSNKLHGAMMWTF